MYKQLLVEVLGIISLRHVRLFTLRTVEVLDSLLCDGDFEMSFEAFLAQTICASRHDNRLYVEKEIVNNYYILCNEK